MVLGHSFEDNLFCYVKMVYNRITPDWILV